MRFLTAVALALVMLWVPVDGVAQEDYLDRLKGIESVKLLVSNTWDDRITGISQDQFRTEIWNNFELGILRGGLKVVDEPIFRLNCKVWLMVGGHDGELVVFRREVALEKLVLLLDLALEKRGTMTAMDMVDDSFSADVWKSGETGQVGMNYLNVAASQIGASCAEDFELAWRRANN